VYIKIAMNFPEGKSHRILKITQIFFLCWQGFCFFQTCEVWTVFPAIKFYFFTLTKKCFVCIVCVVYIVNCVCLCKYTAILTILKEWKLHKEQNNIRTQCFFCVVITTQCATKMAIVQLK